MSLDSSSIGYCHVLLRKVFLHFNIATVNKTVCCLLLFQCFLHYCDITCKGNFKVTCDKDLVLLFICLSIFLTVYLSVYLCLSICAVLAQKLCFILHQPYPNSTILFCLNTVSIERGPRG